LRQVINSVNGMPAIEWIGGTLQSGSASILQRMSIEPTEAATVRRIFQEFAAGKSPRAIAVDLNREGIPGPGGRPWSQGTIRGHACRGNGVIYNELYIGRLVWNRQRFLKDSNTGKRVSRPSLLRA
jgi:site-specific DNA recombinase